MSALRYLERWVSGPLDVMVSDSVFEKLYVVYVQDPDGFHDEDAKQVLDVFSSAVSRIVNETYSSSDEQAWKKICPSIEHAIPILLTPFRDVAVEALKYVMDPEQGVEDLVMNAIHSNLRLSVDHDEFVRRNDEFLHVLSWLETMHSDLVRETGGEEKIRSISRSVFYSVSGNRELIRSLEDMSISMIEQLTTGAIDVSGKKGREALTSGRLPAAKHTRSGPRGARRGVRGRVVEDEDEDEENEEEEGEGEGEGEDEDEDEDFGVEEVVVLSDSEEAERKGGKRAQSPGRSVGTGKGKRAQSPGRSVGTGKGKRATRAATQLSEKEEREAFQRAEMNARMERERMVQEENDRGVRAGLALLSQSVGEFPPSEKTGRSSRVRASYDMPAGRLAEDEAEAALALVSLMPRLEHAGPAAAASVPLPRNASSISAMATMSTPTDSPVPIPPSRTGFTTGVPERTVPSVSSSSSSSSHTQDEPSIGRLHPLATPLPRARASVPATLHSEPPSTAAVANHATTTITTTTTTTSTRTVPAPASPVLVPRAEALGRLPVPIFGTTHTAWLGNKGVGDILNFDISDYVASLVQQGLHGRPSGKRDAGRIIEMLDCKQLGILGTAHLDSIVRSNYHGAFATDLPAVLSMFGNSPALALRILKVLAVERLHWVKFYFYLVADERRVLRRFDDAISRTVGKTKNDYVANRKLYLSERVNTIRISARNAALHNMVDLSLPLPPPPVFAAWIQNAIEGRHLETVVPGGDHEAALLKCVRCMDPLVEPYRLMGPKYLG